MLAVGYKFIRKLRFEEGAKLVSSDGSLEVVNDGSLEGTVSRT